MAELKLSVLDQSVSVTGADEGAAIRDTLDLALHCERLGYARFWVSEHHSLPTIVGSAPEVLMAAIAARTSRIRIGSAGVMLPHYSALKVAEQFRVLEALAPGRIDLGVGRAPGGDMRTARALNPNAQAAADDFPAQVRDLQAWTSMPEHRGIGAVPRGPHAPELWVLGSSNYGAQLAAHFGLPYAYAYFFVDGRGTEEALGLYRHLFKPSERHPVAQTTVCVWALAADTHDEATHQALGRERWRVDRERGIFGALQTPDVIAAQGFTADEWPTIEAMRRKAFVGTASEVGQQLRSLAADLGLDEIVVNTWAHDGRAATLVRVARRRVRAGRCMSGVAPIDFVLRGDYIPLDALLKATGAAPSGGIAKRMVADGQVQVDGHDELRKTCKIRAGQVVSLGGMRIAVWASAA